MRSSQARNAEFSLEPNEVAALIDAAPSERDRLLISVLVYTGIRRAELCGIRKEDVDYSRRRILIREGKGGKQRLVYLPSPVAGALERYASEIEGNFLFPGRHGTKMSARNVNYITRRTGEAAGIKHPDPRRSAINPHLLRHTFARNWKRAGGSLESLQKILGHSSLKTTLDVYGTESQSDTESNYRSMARKLAAWNFSFQAN